MKILMCGHALCLHCVESLEARGMYPCSICYKKTFEDDCDVPVFLSSDHDKMKNLENLHGEEVAILENKLRDMKIGCRQRLKTLKAVNPENCWGLNEVDCYAI
jgi:hypothetical protein